MLVCTQRPRPQSDNCVAPQFGEDRIRDIILALEFFREIWAGITTDCQRIGLYLESIERRAAVSLPSNSFVCSATDDVLLHLIQPDRKTVPTSLVTYLKYTTTLYHGLSRALSLYATGIRALQKGS